MKVYLRIPTNTAPDRELVNWLAWFKERWPDADAEVHYTYSHGVADHRNIIIRGTGRKPGFLQSDCTHLCMIDSDTIPPKREDLVSQFFAAAEQHPVVCGPYPGFRPDTGVFWQVFRHNGHDAMGHDRWAAMPRKRWPDEDVFKADAAGTGCMIIDKEWLLEKCKPDPFYLTRRHDGEIGTEDMNFCRDIGGVHICRNFICDHVKDMNLLQVAYLLRQAKEER